MALLLSLTAGAAIIGSWEGSPDGWIDWSEGQASVDTLPAKYEYSTIGATAGSQSLHLIKSGWNQNLSIKLNAAQKADFMANSFFSIDVTVPADTLGAGGWAEIFNFTINAQGYGWNDQFASPPVQFGFWAGSPVQTKTLIVDYSAIKALITPNPSYLELIITTNSASDRGDFYFDNAKFYVPEPATLTLLGFGAAVLGRRKK
jgi:hypothetical protein